MSARAARAGIECLPWVEYRLALLGGRSCIRHNDKYLNRFVPCLVVGVIVLDIQSGVDRPLNIMDVWVFLLLKAQYNTES